MQRARLCYHVVFAAVLCIALGSFLGCSPQKRYKVLSFFFDGVPIPQGTQGAAGQPAMYIHKPYADGKCGSCHDTDQMELSISQPTNIKNISSSVCLKCHGKVPTQFPVMHGPVAAGACLMCHAPHSSSTAHLLQAPAPRICVQCHTPGGTLTQRPEHKDAKADCLSCHFGHGGTKHGMLRANEPAVPQPVSALPTTLPTLSGLPATRPVASLQPATRPAVSLRPATRPTISALPVAEGGSGL
jgi:predicted CXXCH cytochrome family protein